MSKQSLLVFPLFLLWLLVSCSQSNTDIAAVSVEELYKLSQSGNDIYLLDVRTPQEFENERLAFADANIPYDQLQKQKDKLPPDTTTTMYLFCRSGRRSAIAAGILPKLGYHNVINVEGGIIAWKRAGYQTVSGASK